MRMSVLEFRVGPTSNRRMPSTTPCFVWMVWILIMASSAGSRAATATNIALHRPVTSSAATWSGLVASSLTDGSPDTFAHPQASTGTLGYYFEVDLGKVYQLDKIVLRNRADGCCPDRLTRYGVEVYDNNGGFPGTLNWSSGIRTNGSNSGVAGIDTILATNQPSGLFVGRFIRIVNRSNAAFNPQIAEIEAYGSPPPTITQFTADEDVLAPGQSTTLRWNIVGALGASISPGIGPVAPTGGFVVITPGSTTTYTLTTTNKSGPISATLSVGVGVQLAPPVISEFLASNSGNLKDEDGDSPDWIELRNPNPFGLQLSGYALSDSSKLSHLWVFPTAKIPAKGALIVFASGKNRRDANAGPLHTDFSLSASGDFLALVDRDGSTVLQRFPSTFPNPVKYPKQRENISYGVDAQGKEGFFRPPTPGTTNGTAFAGVVEDVAASLIHGYYSNAISVALSCPTPGVTLRYTTNTTEPTALSGFLYQQPLTITNTTVLRVGAFREGWASSPILTETYLYLSNVIASPVMQTSITRNTNYGPQLYAALTDLPSISIVTPTAINDTTEVVGSFEVIDPTGGPGVQVPCGARNFGGAFTAFDKKSFRFFFRSEYGASKLSYPLYKGFDRGITAVEDFDELELRSGSHDMAMRGFYMSNICTDDTLLEMGQLNPHGRFVHMYLNGVYWGVYHMRERWGAKMHSRYLGGHKEDYESINGNWNVGGWADPGEPYDGDGSIWTKIKSLRANYAQEKAWLDVPQYIDYMLMWMFGGSEDEYRCVGPNTPGSGFKFYLNDADGWFAGSFYNAADDRTVRSAPGRQAGDGPGSVFSMLFKEGTPEYKMLLADRIQQALFGDGALTTPSVLRRLNTRCEEMRRPFYAEAARWNYLTPADWLSRWNEVKTDFLVRRPGEVLTQWRNAGFYPKIDAPRIASIVSAPQAQISFLGPTNVAIFFTTNGTDPRLPNGAISPSAISNQVGTLNELLIPTGATWRWFSDSKGLGRSDIVPGNASWGITNWKHPNFDDSSWAVGRAKFGFGEGDEVTVIPSVEGTNKLVTSYYRTRFVVTNIDTLISLNVRIKRDDGAILYLNGNPVARSSMVSGVVTAATFGTLASDDGKVFNTLSIPVSGLVNGTNTLAVELHQSSLVDDASFDMDLAGTRAFAKGKPGLEIRANTLVKARAWITNSWSALNTSFLQVGDAPINPGDIVFSEIQYNPAGADDTEFLELLNISSHAVNLRGCRMTNGVHFQFADNRDVPLASGGRLILVADRHQFQMRYGQEIPIHGSYTGQLDNGGESLGLYGRDWRWITGLRYGTQSPWPNAADGDGYSLVLAYPQLGLDDPTAWRLSTGTNGSPGSSDTVVVSGSAQVDSDNDGLSDLTEFLLGTLPLDPGSGAGDMEVRWDEAGRFTLSFPRRLGADGYQFRVVWSEDLVHWSPAGLISSLPAGSGMARETWGINASGSPKIFLQLLVQSAP